MRAGAGAAWLCRDAGAASHGSGTPLVICAKGIEKDSGKLVNEILREADSGLRAGDSFRPLFRARCGAGGCRPAVTIAAESGIAARLQASLSSLAFRPYASDDITGVALGWQRPSNVYAFIACGVVEGLGLGEKCPRQFLPCWRGSFAELARLGEAQGWRGAKP